MPTSRTLLTLIALAIGWLSPSLLAQDHVKVSLVAADTSVQPGKSVTVALRMVHAAHWHTYWVNPGTGLPTSLDWKLPAGWKASDILWPAPLVLKDKTGTVTGNGYEGDLLLPVTITAPADAAPGTTVELKVAASWLMCAEMCMPGDANLSLRLAVGSEAPRPDANWGDRIRQTLATLPRALPEWKVTASRTAKAVTLQVTPTGPSSHAPSDLHFFAADNLVGYELPQEIKSDGQGGFVLSLQIAPDAPPDAKRLTGILTAENGWRAGGQPRGLAVAVDFAAAVSGTGSASSTSTPPAPAATTGLAGTLVLAFIGGLILNLMPCVFPVLGIKILGFVNQAGSERRKVVAHGLVFTLGVLLSFWALAAVLAVLRASGDQLGWGFQLQSPAFVYGLAILMLVFALNMSGLFEFGLSATGVGGELQTKSGYAGSFFTGILATVVATPCSAPFLAPALGAALAVSTVESFGIFTAIAVGLSTPYLMLSIFPQAVKILPRPGAWMETFKQFMAFPLYATVAYLVWVLAGQTSEEGFRDGLFGLVMIALAVWVYGRWTAPGASAGRIRFGVIGAVAAGLVGLWLGWPRTAEATPAGAAPEVTWEAWSPEAVAKLRAENRIIYVDFTARWCATCQANKKLVFHSEEVLRYFADKKIATLRADWTNRDPRITAELARYQRSAVPFNVFWIPGKTEPVILPELLTPSIVLDAVRQAAK